MTSKKSSSVRHRTTNTSGKESHHSNGSLHQNGAITTSKRPPPSPTSTSSSLLLIWAPTLALIFGGCCSNVYTLESLIQTSPSSGSLITALQFLIVAIATLPQHLSFESGWRNLYLKKRAIPLKKWIVYTAYFLSVNILNNMAFGYRISIPLHIILRSAGPVTTMAVGRIWGGKRYPIQKVVAVAFLFVGVVLAAISDAWSKPPHVHRDDLSESSSSSIISSGLATQAPGFALLASALLLSACMGLYTDDMYNTHGRSGSITAETLFYSHAMSLPFFATQAKPLMEEFLTIMTISGNSTSSSKLSSSIAQFLPISPQSPLNQLAIPIPVVLLLLNALTQLLCIVGVNRLSAQSTSLTVSIVLNIRKLVSLLLSIWLFGNQLPLGVIIGAAVVFIGGGLYALPTSRVSRVSSSPALVRRNEEHEKKSQ